MAVRSISSVLALLLLGCHASAPTPTPTPPPLLAAPPSASTSVPLEGPSEPVERVQNTSPEPDAPCRPLGYAESACTHDTPYLRARAASDDDFADVDDYDEWFRARGATPPKHLHETTCFQTVLGAEKALLCAPITHDERGRIERGDWYYRVITRRQLYVVRNRRALAVFDQHAHLDPLDSFDFDQEFGPLFGLQLLLDDDGVTLREYREGACDEARETLLQHERKARQEGDRAQVRWAATDRTWVQRLCASVGRYTWQGGVLRRNHAAKSKGTASSPAAPSSPAPSSPPRNTSTSF